MGALALAKTTKQSRAPVVRRKGATIADRLRDRSIPVPECGCLVWLGGTTKFGYGMVSVNGRNVLAHRASWEVNRGQIPDGMNVLHRCDVPGCINPDHLFLGTTLENVRDRDHKGRGKQRNGERHPLSKLTEDRVRAILASNKSLSKLGKEFGVCRQTIAMVRRGRAWKAVPRLATT